MTEATIAWETDDIIAHAILESYENSVSRDFAADIAAGEASMNCLSTPFPFSTSSEHSLRAKFLAYAAYLEEHPATLALDFSYTLRQRRSALKYRISFPATSSEDLRSQITAKLDNDDGASPLGTRAQRKSIILAIFNDAPKWSLQSELLFGDGVSRVHEAAISQPLCTAIQIMLVDLLRAAHVEFDAVIGHSSGEIAAAYAAGYLSARDAICVAYYRGLHCQYAASPNGPIKGSMLAVGTTFEDATALSEMEEFAGRVSIAAVNSSSSVTISGDKDAIEELQVILDDEKKFNRLLKVDQAYHSKHMLPCVVRYVEAMQQAGVTTQSHSSQCSWFSIVYDGQPVSSSDVVLSNLYWAENMTSSVLFSAALGSALSASTEYRAVLEFGAHPALKGPASQTIDETLGESIVYHGTLFHGADAIQSVSASLGFVWSHLDVGAVDLDTYNTAVGGKETKKERLNLIKGLPTYQWKHETKYWHESRTSRHISQRQQTSHSLLGHVSPDSAPHNLWWKNVLKPNEIDWLEGHKLQNQVVFPAAGYAFTVFEAARSLANIQTNRIEARFTYSANVGGQDADLSLTAEAEVVVLLGTPLLDLLPKREATPTHLIDVEPWRLREDRSKQGLGFSGHVRIYSEGRQSAAIQADGISFVPFAGAINEDRNVFYRLHWVLSKPDGTIAAKDFPVTQQDNDLTWALSRIAAYYLRKFDEEVPEDSPVRSDGYLRYYLAYARHMTASLRAGTHKYGKLDWIHDTAAVIKKELDIKGLSNNPDVQLMFIVGEKMPQVFPGETSAIEHLRSSGLLDQYYADGFGMFQSCRWLGAGTGSATKHILNAIDQSFNRYTYTDVSSSFFENAGDLFSKWKEHMDFKVLDAEKSPTQQGFSEGSFDLLVASFVLHATTRLENTMHNLRRLMKPGGLLVVAEGSSDGLLLARDSFIFASLPGWWLGVDEGRILTPLVNIDEWERILKNTGFSGIDTISPPEYQESLGIILFVSQAIENRITLLREPLSAGSGLEKLVIVGGKTNSVSTVIRQLEELLHHEANEIIVYTSLEQVDYDIVTPGSVVEKTLLWVTRGRLEDNPWSNMTVGFGRSAVQEIPDLRLQFLDIPDVGNYEPRMIAETLLRLHETHVDDGSTVVTTIEPEIIMDAEGRQHVPRLHGIRAMNDRYNSAQHPITHQIDMDKSVVELQPDPYGGSPVRQLSRFELYDAFKQGKDTTMVELRVTHSVLSTIRTPIGHQFLIILGVDSWGAHHLALASSVTSRLIIPKTSTAPYNLADFQDAIAFLGNSASQLVALAILDPLVARHRAAVHNFPNLISQAIDAQALAKNISVLRTNDHPEENERFVLSSLPLHCRRETAETLFGSHAVDCTVTSAGILGLILKNVVAFAKGSTLRQSQDAQFELSVASLERFGCNSWPDDPMTIINWTSAISLPAWVTRLDIVPQQIIIALPQIVGVLNGAMVLRDVSIANMTFEQLPDVIYPKVLGSENLDRIFHDNNLDFFVLLSSITYIFGNTGQANYGAAYLGLCGIASNRRKRGLASSVANVGAIIGAGYLQRQRDSTLRATVHKVAIMPLSEEDLHQMFAEAVETGNLDSPDGPEISTGLLDIVPKSTATPKWFSHPKFSHFVFHKTASNRDTKEQTAATTIQINVKDVVPDRMFQELGFDSLISVDIRTWFLKNFQVGIPVLKIMGNQGMMHLVEFAAESIPEEPIPRVTQGEKENQPKDSVVDSSSQSSQAAPEETGTAGSVSTGSLTVINDRSMDGSKPDKTTMDNIDWEAESCPPDNSTQLTSSTPRSNSPKGILVTGSTGLLGHHLLDTLLETLPASKIICVAVRRLTERLETRKLPPPSGRLGYYEGDLRQPLLGLSQQAVDAIFDEVEAVIHDGSDTSHFKYYHSVRDANVGSTYQLLRLCLPRGIPFLYVSSAGIALFEGQGRTDPFDFPESSVARAGAGPAQLRTVPTATGAGNGPANACWNARDTDDETAEAEFDWVNSLLRYAHRIKAVPQVEHTRGAFNFVYVWSICADIIRPLVEDDEPSQRKVTYTNNVGDFVLPLDRLPDNGEDYEMLLMGDWTRKAIAAGLHPAVAALIESINHPGATTFPNSQRARRRGQAQAKSA
ncbi:polyketide synthase/peptide synthetase [Colletotrichum orchidophilum]|uniref:Polyketide synthase/peptide synthetase n=1 Tax=Colletotrichum orchidophilum TaxID=1209926 RepID=A0A1G4B9K1_9PEZI|nr:polyketide synthase/peptide synthetase [Colletotrichum orchidophilum]OHE98079.1 polyketide synthase/peptide synthetase [Colletotrichum orchidophilum]